MDAFKVKSELAELDKIRLFLKESLKNLKISEEEYFMVELSLVEICTNIMRYAYPHDKGDIFVKIWLQEDSVFLEIRDEGIPFNPQESKDPDMNEVLKTGKTGGLGIYLSRKFMDGFDYERKNDQNIVTIYKIIKK